MQDPTLNENYMAPPLQLKHGNRLDDVNLMSVLAIANVLVGNYINIPKHLTNQELEYAQLVQQMCLLDKAIQVVLTNYQKL